MPSQLAYWGHICGLLGVGEEGEVLGDLPDHDFGIVRGRGNDAVVEGVPASEIRGRSFRPGEAWSRAHQSVSRTAEVCPRNKGMRSGSFPFSFRGMTAKAPPPLDSQLTERYSGLACSTAGSQYVSSHMRFRGEQARTRARGGRASDLDQVGIPGIATDADVVVAELFPRGLAENVACGGGISAWLRGRMGAWDGCMLTKGEREAGREDTHDIWKRAQSGQK